MQKLLHDVVIQNIVSLVNPGKCGTISKTYTDTVGYYVVKFIFNPVKIKEENNTYRKFFEAGEPLIKGAHQSSIQY